MSIEPIKAKNIRDAIRIAKDKSQVPRVSRGGIKIPASTLNETSRGPRFKEMLLHKTHDMKEHSIGMRDPYTGAYYVIHADGHPHMPGGHHDIYHIHGFDPKGEEFLIIIEDPQINKKTSISKSAKGFIKQEYKKKNSKNSQSFANKNNYQIKSLEKYGLTNSLNTDITNLKKTSSASIALRDTKSFNSINEITDYFQKISNSFKESKLNANLNSIKQIGKGSMTLLNYVSIGIDVSNISLALTSGNYKQAAALATQMLFSYLGSFLGGLVTSGGGPLVIIGGLVGGTIGNYIGSKISKFLFGNCLTSAGLNEKNGKTGGVEVRTITSLSPLKTNVFFLFSKIDLIAFPINFEISKTIEQLLPGVELNFIVHRIIYELYYGIVVQEAPLLFSLHFAKEGFLYTVIHPYYRNTLTGYILGLLDYFLKGFVNGGVYNPQFLLDWDKTKNMDSDYLRKNIIDIREELRKDNLQSIGYLSLRELYDDEDEFNNGKQKYFSAFRILGKTKKVHICDHYIIPDCDFDVEHDLNPSFEVVSDLSKADSKDCQNKYKLKEEIYQVIHKQIHEKMPQVPIFSPWFELLKIVSFGAHYVQTLIETGNQPCIPEPDLIKPFPVAMPPIPVRRAKTFNINLTIYDFFRQLTPDVIKKIDLHMCKIINDEVFDFILIENLLKDESRKTIKEKLKNHLPIQQIEHRDDSELQIEEISKKVQTYLQFILLLQSHELVNWYKSFNQSFIKNKKSFEDVLIDINNLTFKQKLALIRQNLPSLIRKEMHEFLSILDKRIQDLTNQYDVERQNINRKFSEINQSENELLNRLQSNVAQEQQKARNWRDEKIGEINRQISMYSSSQINWTAVNDNKRYYENQYSEIIDDLARQQREKINYINNEFREKRRICQQISDENDNIFNKKKNEFIGNKNKCEIDFNNELRNVENIFKEFENRKQMELSSYLQLGKKEFDDNLKKIILLDNIRLFFIDINLDSAWAQNIRGGCFIKADIEPEIVQSPSLPFQTQLFEDNNFETRIQNYLISGILTEHRWYASPNSFINSNLEMKKESNTTNIDNLGGKRMLDFVIEIGNVDLLRNINIQNINSPSLDGFSPLLTAVALSNYEMVKVLLNDYKADYNYKHPNGLTPLIAATQSGNTDIALLLLEQPHIQMNVSLDNGMSPMHFAVLNSDINVIKRMTDLGLFADSEESIRNQDGCNAFLYAAKLGYIKGLEEMKIKNKDCCSADGSNALHWAASNNSNSLKCTELLYKKFKVSPDKQNCRKQYPIHVAIEARNDDSAIFLYDIFPQCALVKDDKNKTVKDLAIIYGAVGFLSHAFPNQSILCNIIPKENRNIEDAIQDAIFRNNLPDTSRLIGELSNQKDISIKLEKLIKSALIVGSEQLLDIVVRATPDIKIIKFSHQMVLSHLVAQSGQNKLVSAVSKFGFTFDEKDDLGNTPMWYALIADDSKTMKKILKCRENTDNLMGIFQNAAQKAFEDQKPKCIQSLMKYQKKIKNKIQINGTYLCNNLNVVSNDVNKAIQMGLEIKKSDVYIAASKSLPEVLTLIIQYFCKECVSLKKEIIKECVKIACKDVRLDNILALRKLSDGIMNDYFITLINEMRYAKYSFWIIEALKGDPKNLIQNQIQEIGNLLKHGIDLTFSNKSGIRKKLIEILEGFPLKNMAIENGLPFLYYAIRFNAIWSFSCLPKDYDMSHKIDGCIVYDFLPYSYNMLINPLILKSPEDSSLWFSLNVNDILESLTINFSEICVNSGCPYSFISILCKTILNKSKSLKSTTLLHILIRSKASIKDLEPIIKSRKDWCQKIDQNGWTPLMHAVCIQNFELAKLLIENIPSEIIEFRDYLGNNVLHLLIWFSNSENRDLSDLAMELITKCPQLLRMQNRNGETPCSIAAYKGNVVLLAAFRSFNSFDSESLIHSATKGNQVDVIKFLMNSNCSSIRVDPNARLQQVTNKSQVLGDNFLHTAARYGSVDAFIELVKLGTNPIQTNSKNVMPIEIAFQIGNTKMIEFILSLPCVLNASSMIKNIAITSCAKGSRKNINCLDAMIKCGFSIESMDQYGNPLIHCAAISDNADAIHLVLNSGADILALSDSKMTVLHFCSILNKPNALRTLLDWASFCLSFDEYHDWIDAKNEEDNTALHLASEANNDICVSILLAYGADEQCLNSKKLTASQLAVVSNSLNSLGVLKQVVNDTTFNGAYPLEYNEIVNKFKERINKNEISIPELFDTITANKLIDFAKQVNERLLPLDQDTIDKMANEDKKVFQDDDSDIDENKLDEFYTSFGNKYGKNCLDILEKLSSYQLSQITLVQTIENNQYIIKDIITIFENIEISTITTILPNIPTNSLIPFFKTINEIIKIAEHCPAIWEWFKEYFILPCNPSFLCERNEIPQNSDFTEPFDYFIMILNQSKCYNDLPWPKLPRLSVFNGKRCSMLSVKEALSQCTNKALQIRNINEIPLDYERIQELVTFINRPKYFGDAFQWCRDGSNILNMSKNIKNEAILATFNPINNLDAFTLLTIRAMLEGITISNIVFDLRNEKEDTKYMIIKVALQLNQSDFGKVREWCSAALFCSEQCGSGILEKICNLITFKKCSLSDVLYICNIISRLNDISQIGSALISTNPKEKITELIRIEDNSKNFETLIKEMSTSLKSEFQPYKFAFDGTPMICLRNEDILALRIVYDSLKSFNVPSTKREIQAEVSRLGKEMQMKPNEQSLGQLLAILSHSFEIIFKIRPYLIQCITVAGLVLSEIHPITGLKGRIAQVATGEGKSIDIVLLASICAAQGRCVDIITSTHYLAQRDYQKFAPFYEFIGLSCNCIAKLPMPSTEDFNGLILYGINTDFEFTLLTEGINSSVIQKTQLTKGGPLKIRKQNTIITDESDNLFIDNANNSARIAWKSNENVSWVFAPLYSKLSETSKIDIKDVRCFLSSYLDGKFVDQVNSWSDDKLDMWISSFLVAQSKVNGRDYVIGTNKHTRQKEVQIIHLGTGRIQYGSRWSNGVHEFIETREGIIPENENYTIASISHISFFGRYKYIYGLTGTAGELVERNEVMESYHIDSFDVPPNRKCLRKRLPTEILNSNDELQKRLIQIVNETQRQNRPLLLLFLSIDDTIKFSQLLSEKKIVHMVMNELQREDEDYIVFRAGQPGVITIATNTAGRGTDIVLSPTSKANGGLRVAFTFFPENFRVECQGLGRAGRQGQPGTAEIITSLDDPYIIKLIGKLDPSIQRDEIFIKNLYQQRSKQIKSQSESRMIHSIYEIKLFNILSVFFAKLKKINEQFENNGTLQKEFANVGFNSTIIWKFIKYVLQRKWAELFSYLSQKSNIDQTLIDRYFHDYENNYLTPLLSADKKNVVIKALNIYHSYCFEI